MSVKLYGKMWIATAADLNDLLLREKVVQELKPVFDRHVAHRIFASLYARYVIIVNNLGDIFDQTLQVQKRELVQRILEAATRRLLELQNEMKDIEMSEFLYIDQTLIEEKFIPSQVQLLRPFYFPIKRTPIIQDIINGVRKPVNSEVDESEKKTLKFMLEEAKRLEAAAALNVHPLERVLTMIKSHEKARQARCLLTNIRMHPKYYYPQPPPEAECEPYTFFHKEEQAMLIPVKKTVYESDFTQTIRTFSKMKFYENPETRAPPVEPEIIEEIVSENEISTADSQEDAAPSKTSSMREHIRLEEERVERRRIQTIAAIKIQRFYLRYRIRKLVKLRRLKRYQILGMADERQYDFSERNLTEINREMNRAKKSSFDAAFVAACEDTKARIVKLRSPWIMEDISDHIRYWFREMYDAGGEFDKFPPALKGGTILVMRGETASPWEFAEVIKKRKEMAAKSAEERKKILDEEKKKKAAEKAQIKLEKLKLKQLAEEKKKLAEKEGKRWDFSEREFITTNFINLDKTMEEYEHEWRFINEFANVKSLPYTDWIDVDKYAELHMELRVVVDELMRLEFELLQMALCTDLKKKYKAPKPPKAKKGKNKKGKIEVPITFGDKSYEEVYDEMAEAGVICSVPKCNLENYIGDINYCAYEMRNYYDQNPNHCMGEVIDILRSWTLGMGPLNITKPKSICIAGPPGCGKKFIVNALATDIDAVVFNLSPSVIIKFADNTDLFISNVSKMAKLMAPSILFINGAHYPFIKKIAPEDRPLNPKLLSKYLPKMLKQIKPDEKIMLLGTTSEPWNAAIGKMKKIYEKIILCPGSDYGSTFLTWRTGTLNMIGVDRLTDFSSLSKVTQYYGTEQILNAIQSTVNLKRRVRLPIAPLTSEELLEELLTGPAPNFPMDLSELEKYRKWFSKANKFSAMRAAYMAALATDDKKK